MSLKDRLKVHRLETDADREQGLSVLRATYTDEKAWAADAESQLPAEDVGREDVSWFLVNVDDKPVGILRVLYDPPLEMYANYGFELLADGIDVEAFVRENKIAEIGRFAVLPDYRRYMMVVAALMRAAATETVSKGYTHYITDVFEDDPHSPYQFHTRVMGFQPVATHDVGELNCRSRRITLVLDLAAAYRRLKEQGNWIFRFFTDGWDEAIHRRFSH